MLEVLIGIGLSIITQIAKKSKTSARIIILILSVIAGGVYYFFKQKYPELLEEVWTYTLGVYGISQIVYNYIFALFEEKDEQEKKEDLDPNKEE
jgi:xanthine/uracil permease